MFGRRPDGKKVKDLQIIDKAMPYFMPIRIDAVNYYQQPIKCEPLDKFILEQKKLGIHYSYTEILMAACVRMLHERPKTNRFISNCMVYQRDQVYISMSIKKSLTDDGEEITLKIPFTGRESLTQVKEKLDAEIEKNVKADSEVHKTTKTAGFLCKLPGWAFKFAMCLLRFGDKHGLLPHKLLDASPFHTSIFIADLRSIKLDKVYHHLYCFGNTTIFATLGKVKYEPVSDRSGNITTEKRLTLGFSLDERVCDGLYYSHSIRFVQNLVENPSLLLEPLPEPELTGKALRKKLKADKKEEKRRRKLEKKNSKRGK